MKRLLILFLLITLPAEAGPKHLVIQIAHEVAHHKRFEFAAGAWIGASILQWKANTYCQRGAPETCFGGYGSHKDNTFNWFSFVTGGAMLGAAEGCWKHDAGKFCYALAYGTPAAQVSFGIHDFVSYKPETKKQGIP